MLTNLVGIYIDNQRILINIFKKVTTQPSITKQHYASFNLKSDNESIVGQIIEIIGSLATSNFLNGPTDWKICAKDLPLEISQKISKATNLEIKNITMLEEPNLICQGLIAEMITTNSINYQ